jgi:hypothetical protein
MPADISVPEFTVESSKWPYHVRGQVLMSAPLCSEGAPHCDSFPGKFSRQMKSGGDKIKGNKILSGLRRLMKLRSRSLEVNIQPG